MKRIAALLRGYPMLPALAATAMVFALSSIPGTMPETSATARLVYFVPPAIQNLLHLPVYALLGFLWHAAIGGRTHRAALAAWLLVAVLGVADEIWQSLIPGRYPSFTDLALDWTGAVLGVLAYRGYRAVADSSSSRT